MKRVAYGSIFVVLLTAGCGVSQDDGFVAGCFGFVNETVPGQGVFSTQIVTNGFFGGCSPDDPGMQIVERTTAAGIADQNGLVAACNSDCTARLAAYAQAHPDAALPLTCQTLFAIPCDGLGADVSALGSGAGKAFEAGGPADTRIALTGTVTISVTGQTATVPAHGIIDGTMAPCQGANLNCPVTLSRLDVVSDSDFTINGSTFSAGHVQNQGLATGQKNAGELLIGAGAIEAELSATVNGSQAQLHVTNSNQLKSTTNLTLETFFSTLDVTMTDGSVSAHIQMTGTPIGHRPVAAFTPTKVSYECQCKSCTTVEFTSAATDPDNDLQSLSWQLDGVPQLGDASGAPELIDFQLPLGNHNVSLVATDTRGAASGTSLAFKVVDTTPPVITRPPNLQLTSCSFPDIGQATATDICSDTVVITSNASGNYSPGTTTVTWTAEDGSLNDATATQTITFTQVSDLRTCCPAGYNVIVVSQSNTQPVNGTAGNDCIIGTSNNDVINGQGGNDIIFGQGGQDTITTGAGDDIIFGGDGDDIINAGAGNNKVAGGTGQDRITTGAGNDVIIGGDGDDVIDAGNGDDRIYGNQGQDHITGGPGNDFIDGGFGDDQINGGSNPAVGDLGDDLIVGSFDNDTIVDTLGNNTIEGFDGDDPKLQGGSGNDTILGGKGHNLVCIGGGGNDTLSFCNN